MGTPASGHGGRVATTAESPIPAILEHEDVRVLRRKGSEGAMGSAFAAGRTEHAGSLGRAWVHPFLGRSGRRTVARTDRRG
jgi:hypothetical protein